MVIKTTLYQSGAKQSTIPGEVPLPASSPLLTVIIPVFNEADTIDEVIRRVKLAPYDKQILIVDDASTDGTAARLDAWDAPPAVEVLSHAKNRGKGAAIRTGLAHAVGRYTIIQDGDLEYDPNEYPLLIEPLDAGTAEVVYGSRFLWARETSHRGRRLFDCGIVALNFFVRILYGARITDEATCYKAFSTATLRRMNLQCERFEFCPEVTAKAIRLGLRIHEVPISYRPRSSDEGKKIRLRDGYQALQTLWKWRSWQPPAEASDGAAE